MEKLTGLTLDSFPRRAPTPEPSKVNRGVCVRSTQNEPPARGSRRRAPTQKPIEQKKGHRPRNQSTKRKCENGLTGPGVLLSFPFWLAAPVFSGPRSLVRLPCPAPACSCLCFCFGLQVLGFPLSSAQGRSTSFRPTAPTPQPSTSVRHTQENLCSGGFLASSAMAVEWV